MCAELAGKKELESYDQFLREYAGQLKGIQNALDDSLGDAWDFGLDPVALQVHGYAPSPLSISRRLAGSWSGGEDVHHHSKSL